MSSLPSGGSKTTEKSGLNKIVYRAIDFIGGEILALIELSVTTGIRR
jgi:hypothetical protein